MRKRHYTGFLRKRAIMTIGMGLLLFAGVSGCKDQQNLSASNSPATATPSSSDPQSVSEILNALGERMQGATGGVQKALAPQGEALHEMTKEEVEKLFRWEYRVVGIAPPLTVETLQGRLTELGNEGWECFHVHTTDKEAIVSCKRRPRSAIHYLKLIPGM